MTATGRWRAWATLAFVMFPAYLLTSPLRAADRRSGPRALCLAQPALTGARDGWSAAAIDQAALGDTAAGPGLRGPARCRGNRGLSFAAMAMTSSSHSGLSGLSGHSCEPGHLLRWLEQRRRLDHVHGLCGLGFRLDRLALEDLAPRVSADLEMVQAEQRWLVGLWSCGDRLTHFERLGLAPTCDQAAIRRAYLAVAQRLHPDRYYGKHIGRFAAVLVELFHRARAAQTYLADPRRCARYLGQLADAGHLVAQAPEQHADVPAA